MTGRSAFLLLCYFMAQVSGSILPPRNLKITSVNFKHILTWEDDNKESPIYYHVEYSKSYTRLFKTAKDCSNITVRHCDLSKDFTDINNSYAVRVRSITEHGSSVSSFSESITPVEQTVLGPPVVDIVACDRCIKVFIQPPMSHLWSEDQQQYVSMVSDDGFVRMESTIKVALANEVLPHELDISEKNYTLISNLLPNANYCVSVSILQTSPPNIKATIPSKVRCVVTEYHENGSSTVYIVVAVAVVCGALLLAGLVLALIGLDVAGYICKARTFIPKVLKSLPTSESSFSYGSEFISPTTISIPVEISTKTEMKQNLESQFRNCEGGYANRKRLVDSDTSGTTTSGELPSAVSSSIESSGQTNSSAGEDLSAGHLGNSMPSSVSITPVPVRATDDSSNISLDTRGVFNINLNTVSIADPADVWTGIKQVEVPQVEAEESVDSHKVGIAQDQHSSVHLDFEDLEEEYCSDYEEEDVSETSDSDSRLISGYMKR